MTKFCVQLKLISRSAKWQTRNKNFIRSNCLLWQAIVYLGSLNANRRIFTLHPMLITLVCSLSLGINFKYILFLSFKFKSRIYDWNLCFSIPPKVIQSIPNNIVGKKMPFAITKQGRKIATVNDFARLFGSSTFLKDSVQGRLRENLI